MVQMLNGPGNPHSRGSQVVTYTGGGMADRPIRSMGEKGVRYPDPTPCACPPRPGAAMASLASGMDSVTGHTGRINV